MATFKISIFKHQLRADGKYPVSIRVYWKRQYGYIGTEYYVTIHQIQQNAKKGIFELKDTSIIGELTKRIKLFEKAKSERLGLKIYNHTAKELAEYFSALIAKKQEDIDFIEFGRNYCEKRKAEGKYFDKLKTTLNSLEDFTKSKTFSVYQITSRFLTDYEKYLRTNRTILRKNQFGKDVTTKRKPVTDVGVAGYMTDIRILFNEMIAEYNDEETGNIKIFHYPFKKYKLPKLTEAPKRNISKDEVLKIINVTDAELRLNRAVFARDIFLLSFLLVGMNAKDMYNLKINEHKKGRITYNRAKTKGRRKDKALFSIKVEPEALELIKKYTDQQGDYFFDFHTRYSSPSTFISAIDKGLKTVAKVCEIDIPLSFYYARHSWATIARNKCKIPKSDIDECLNHVGDLKMADVYIEKDWSMIDEANQKVIDYIYTGEIS